MRNGPRPGPVPSKTTERFSLRYFPCTQTKWRDQAGCTNTKGRTGTPLAYDSHAGTRPRGVGPAAWCCRRRKPTNRCCGRANQSRYDLHTHFAAETRSAALVDFLRFAAELLAPTPTAPPAPTAPAMPPTRTAIGLDST